MGTKEEKELAKRIGGRRRPRSGGIPGHRGDVQANPWLIEEKAGAFNMLKRLWDEHGGEDIGLDLGFGILQEFQWPLKNPPLLKPIHWRSKSLRNLWSKIVKEARGEGLLPLLVFSRLGLCLRSKLDEGEIE
ncbi:MAG: hypothetical protein QXI19_05945 [Candidatus Caldarchaeum sp.]